MAKKITLTEEELEKLVNDKIEKANKKAKLESDKKKYLRLSAGAATGTALGAGMYGLGKHLEGVAKKGPVQAALVDPRVVKGLKKQGKILGGVAGLGTGFAKYMHHKTKKELKEFEKEDGNSKK